MSTNDNSSAADVDAETAEPTQPTQLTPIARQLEKSRQSLLDLIEGQYQQLARVQAMLEAGDSDGLYRYFEEAKQTRDDWLDKQ